MLSRFAEWLFARLGWKVAGEFPFHVPKFVIAAAPHTSNWDFPLGLFTQAILKAPIKWAGKHTLFMPPHGFFFRWVGGIPVDRTKRTNFVEAVIHEFEVRDKLWLTVAPEGQRQRVDKFKTGFYFIAKGAKVPIVLCRFDWEKREVFFDKNLFWPTDDVEKDLAFIWEYFRGVKGKRPENGIF